MSHFFSTLDIEALQQAESLQAADAALCQLMSMLDAEKFSYNYYPGPLSGQAGAAHVLCTAESKDWQAHYSARKYEEIDAIHKSMRKSIIPLAWRLDDVLRTCTEDQKAFL